MPFSQSGWNLILIAAPLLTEFWAWLTKSNRKAGDPNSRMADALAIHRSDAGHVAFLG
jgi:hypothetical protein